MKYISWLLLWFLHLALVVKNFCLFTLGLIDIWLRGTSSVLLRSLGSSGQIHQLISRSFLWFPGVFFCGVTEEALVHLGSALLVWEQNLTKLHLKDKPSQTTKQCWLFLLCVVVLCLGGDRAMASLVSAPAQAGASPSEGSEGE